MSAAGGARPDVASAPRARRAGAGGEQQQGSRHRGTDRKARAKANKAKERAARPPRHAPAPGARPSNMRPGR